MINSRHETAKHRRLVTISPDGATHWSKSTLDESLAEPVCMASIVRVRHPTTSHPGLIAFANPDNFKSRKRENVSVKLSTDDAKTWTANRSIEPGISGYSDLTALSDGTVLCVL